MNLPFWKVESIGNHFPLLHAEDLPADVSVNDLAISLCASHFGIGGDGLLILGQEESDLRLRMFNPDGTEDFCGNGIRCAAVHAHGLGWVGDSFMIQHRNQSVNVVICGGVVSTTIGPADYTPEAIPLKGPRLFNATVWSGMESGMPLSLFGSVLTTGSTHAIIPTMSIPDDDSFISVSRLIENDEKFPERTSVIWVQELELNRLKIRIWERGVGETMGCGTGSSAAAADYLRRKNRGGMVEVQNPGGSVKVSMDRWDSPITVEGSAREVFRGVWC